VTSDLLASAEPRNRIESPRNFNREWTKGCTCAGHSGQVQSWAEQRTAARTEL